MNALTNYQVANFYEYHSTNKLEHMASYLLNYLNAANYMYTNPQQYDIIWRTSHGQTACKQTAQQLMQELQKVKYQKRYKKGNLYDFEYIISQLFLYVLELFLDYPEKSYKFIHFRNYLTARVNINTIPKKNINNTKTLLLCTGNLYSYDDIYE